nr:MAG TPA: hypothetical protein [Caudoviricetes sp.]
MSCPFSSLYLFMVVAPFVVLCCFLLSYIIIFNS